MKAVHPIVAVGATRILAPLVGGSDLAFRLLCRQYGAQVTFTEMIQARYFNHVDALRKQGSLQVQFHPSDRPLILQVAAAVDEADEVIRMVNSPVFAGHIDGLDLNCGCPQGFAQKRGIGAFTFREPDALVELVRKIARSVPYPLSVKCRMHEDGWEATAALLQRLADAGASLITLHGRTWRMKGEARGLADWAAMRQVQEAIAPVPLVANGDIACHADFERIIKATNAVAGMSGYGALLNPGSVFSPTPIPLATQVQDYLTLALQCRNRLIDLQRHLAWLTKRSVPDKSLKAALFQTRTLPALVHCLRERLDLDIQINLDVPHQIELPVAANDIEDPKRRAAFEKKQRQRERKAQVKKRAREEREEKQAPDAKPKH